MTLPQLETLIELRKQQKKDLKAVIARGRLTAAQIREYKARDFKLSDEIADLESKAVALTRAVAGVA